MRDNVLFVLLFIVLLHIGTTTLANQGVQPIEPVISWGIPPHPKA
ncbi:hypothetical protein [Mesorhizobium sophorae]|nr:hypothetical protein [Mesorhizobium sophorae]